MKWGGLLLCRLVGTCLGGAGTAAGLTAWRPRAFVRATTRLSTIQILYHRRQVEGCFGAILALDQDSESWCYARARSQTPKVSFWVWDLSAKKGILRSTSACLLQLSTTETEMFWLQSHASGTRLERSGDSDYEPSTSPSDQKGLQQVPQSSSEMFRREAMLRAMSNRKPPVFV